MQHAVPCVRITDLVICCPPPWSSAPVGIPDWSMADRKAKQRTQLALLMRLPGDVVVGLIDVFIKTQILGHSYTSVEWLDGEA